MFSKKEMEQKPGVTANTLYQKQGEIDINFHQFLYSVSCWMDKLMVCSDPIVHSSKQVNLHYSLSWNKKDAESDDRKYIAIQSSLVFYKLLPFSTSWKFNKNSYKQYKLD